MGQDLYIHSSAENPFYQAWKLFCAEIWKMLECHFWADAMLRQSRFRTFRASPAQKLQGLRVVCSKNFSRATFFVFWSTQMVNIYLSYLPVKQTWWKSAVCVCLLSDTRHFLPALYWAQWLGSTIMWISKQNRANCHDGRWIQRTDICIVLVNLILCCWAILCQCFLEKLSFEKLCSKEMHTFQTIFSKLQPIWKTEKILLLGWKRHWDFLHTITNSGIW